MTVRFRSKNIGRCVAVALVAAIGMTGHAQTSPTSAANTADPAAARSSATAGVTPPAGYLIGPEDVLVVSYWREKDMAAEVTVRPDGKISLPLVNEVHAAGLTPGELHDRISAEAKRFVEDPNVTVVVKQI